MMEKVQSLQRMLVRPQAASALLSAVLLTATCLLLIECYLGTYKESVTNNNLLIKYLLGKSNACGLICLSLK